MPKNERLNVPHELQHLLEKREQQDRRADQRRSEADQQEGDQGSLDAVDLAKAPDSPVTGDQPSGEDRRTNQERRQTTRREEDGNQTH